MFTLVLVGWWGLQGCGVPRCEELCRAQADCLEAEIASYGTNWGEWTGYTDRASFERACLSVFEESLDGGAPRGDLQETCRDELAGDVCGST